MSYNKTNNFKYFDKSDISFIQKLLTKVKYEKITQFYMWHNIKTTTINSKQVLKKLLLKKDFLLDLHFCNLQFHLTVLKNTLKLLNL